MLSLLKSHMSNSVFIGCSNREVDIKHAARILMERRLLWEQCSSRDWGALCDALVPVHL